MAEGQVKWFSTEKGYGFIQQQSGDDIFVHANDTNGAMLQEGDKVKFEVGEGRKGPCAKNVTVV